MHLAWYSLSWFTSPRFSNDLRQITSWIAYCALAHCTSLRSWDGQEHNPGNVVLFSLLPCTSPMFEYGWGPLLSSAEQSYLFMSLNQGEGQILWSEKTTKETPQSMFFNDVCTTYLSMHRLHQTRISITLNQYFIVVHSSPIFLCVDSPTCAK